MRRPLRPRISPASACSSSSSSANKLDLPQPLPPIRAIFAGLQRRRGTGEQELLAPAQRNVLENNHALIVILDSPSILTLNLLLALNAPELGVLSVGLNRS
ncbi:MAG: hypothetical protein CM15mP103_08950 [Gammaproteobacteria bacterium]|nr:MAG: hypothetical protein CM15mP103_08950 [Gammaproteobacteria bacterium]